LLWSGEEFHPAAGPLMPENQRMKTVKDSSDVVPIVPQFVTDAGYAWPAFESEPTT
jgi:hypothetical protein